MSGNNIDNKGFFWSEKRFEPKRTFRWKVRFDNLLTHIPPQYVISVQKPSISTAVENIPDLGTPKYIKGQMETKPIEIVCIDDEQNTVTNWIHYYYKLAGLNFGFYEIGNLSQYVLTDKTRNIEISVLNELGNVIEQYRLHNGWIAEVSYSTLNYTETGLSTYTLKIVYDNFEYLVSPKSGEELSFDPLSSNVKQDNSDNPVSFSTHNNKLQKIHGHAPQSAATKTPDSTTKRKIEEKQAIPSTSPIFVFEP